MIEREQLQKMPRIELVDQRKLRKPEKCGRERVRIDRKRLVSTEERENSRKSQ